MKKTKLWLCILLSFLFCLAVPAAASAQENEDADVTLAPYFFIENADPDLDSFPLKGTDVVTNINGCIAETYVTQTYANEGTRAINARYLFPASTKVSVHGMTMQIGDQVVTAKIKEKEDARTEFEQAKSEGKSASLLEQQRPNVFTMDVANIMPGDTVLIELHYTELISPTEGTWQFVFPTVVGPRYSSPAQDENGTTQEWVETPYLPDGETPDCQYNITVNLSAGVPISGIASGSHEIYVEQDRESARVTLSNPEVYAGNRDFILDYKLTGTDINSGLLLHEGESENFFLLTIQPPERYESDEVPGREYIFVLDISGSMYGYPLDTAKELIRDLVGSLKETDKFNVILFADDVTPLAFGSLPASSENIRRAVDLIDRTDGGGGTELLHAVETALATPADEDLARSIVIITDGYISGEKRVFDLISKNADQASFFPFGIGTSVNRYLIEGIAGIGSGESFVVTEESEVEAMAKRFRTYIQSPLLTNIQITYDGFDAYDVEPAVPSTLFAQKPIVLYGKWKGEASGTIRITGKTGKQDYVQEISVSNANPQEINSAIPYLWARSRVDRLANYELNDDSESVKQEITNIGLTYSMMTQYTSFIAVVETVRNPDVQSSDVDQPQPLPSGVSNLAIGTGYTIGSEPGSLIFGFMLQVLALTGILQYRKKRRL
ncbi:MAG: VIT and VWA domain-containing protein [Eubacteriales bacterium]|nr:VIT and VWA domain-containing protein [Eubacteriales bacterium]